MDAPAGRHSSRIAPCSVRRVPLDAPCGACSRPTPLRARAGGGTSPWRLPEGGGLLGGVCLRWRFEYRQPAAILWVLTRDWYSPHCLFPRDRLCWKLLASHGATRTQKPTAPPHIRKDLSVRQVCASLLPVCLCVWHYRFPFLPFSLPTFPALCLS